MSWLVAGVALLATCALASAWARQRQWRLGRWTRFVSRPRTVEVRAGERRSFVRVGRDQWCEQCGTSFWWVLPHPLVLSPSQVIFVLCEPCHRDMSPQQRLQVYAGWWLARYQREADGIERLPELQRADVRRRLQAEFASIRSSMELGL